MVMVLRVSSFSILPLLVNYIHTNSSTVKNILCLVIWPNDLTLIGPKDGQETHDYYFTVECKFHSTIYSWLLV